MYTLVCDGKPLKIIGNEKYAFTNGRGAKVYFSTMDCAKGVKDFLYALDINENYPFIEIIDVSTLTPETMGLEGLLHLCGSNTPFDDNGELTVSGIYAEDKLIQIAKALYNIGASNYINNEDALENYLDSIIRQGT